MSYDEADVGASLDRLKAAGDTDTQEAFTVDSKPQGTMSKVYRWATNLPKNVTVGVLDAALNMAHTADDIETQLSGNRAAKEKSAVAGGAAPIPGQGADKPAPEPMLSPEVSQAVYGFRDVMAEGSQTSDEVTQAIAQYAIPFMGFAKLIGGLQGASVISTIIRAGTAEAATAATVLGPHDPRMADVLALGRTVEGKFGNAMRAVAPDGSLFNHYIDYMTDREGEGNAEGRFKNVVDNLALTAAAATMIKATAVTMKGGYKALKKAMTETPEAAVETK